MAIMGIYLMQRGEDLVLREANYCVMDECDLLVIMAIMYIYVCCSVERIWFCVRQTIV
jgi:hypothetical protein